jgi:hypothetical protein
LHVQKGNIDRLIEAFRVHIDLRVGRPME